mmetsp:Transcript_11822/g.19982  ORF Transcript_11822/g.19982 Transcript_11822/m.19982 type:complete len:893 (-) Transcript_11822:38-2716(-)
MIQEPDQIGAGLASTNVFLEKQRSMQAVAFMDEHTDWVNQLIYLEESDALLSCSNDTTVKIWKMDSEVDSGHYYPCDFDFSSSPANQHPPRVLNSFYTFSGHKDYVRAMSFSSGIGRLFSVADDGHLIVTDINEQKVISEFNYCKVSKYDGALKSFDYLPYSEKRMLMNPVIQFRNDQTCATCVASNQNGNQVVIGYSDDSFILQDVRQEYRNRIRLEHGGHSNTVRTASFSKSEGDFLLLSGGSDCKLRLWDLRMRKCIRDYGGTDGDFPVAEWGNYHSDSIWTVNPTSSFESCFTGGRDGSIFHTDLVGDEATLLYNGRKNPITSLAFDEQTNLLWFSSANDSSIRHINLNHRSIDSFLRQDEMEEGASMPEPRKNEAKRDVNLEQPDYESSCSPAIVEYHILRNKRYIITRDLQGTPALWNVNKGQLIKQYNSKSFEQVKRLMDTKYDIPADQTPYPPSWFSVDIKLGCLSIHLDEDNWQKCKVSEMQTNIQWMLNTPSMDNSQQINYDMEERLINLGHDLVLQELLHFNPDIAQCFHETLVQNLQRNYEEFRQLYLFHLGQINRELDYVEEKLRQKQLKDPSAQLLSPQQPEDEKQLNGSQSTLNKQSITPSRAGSVSKAWKPKNWVNLVYLSDKNTQKPYWVSNKSQMLQKMQEDPELAYMRKLINNEKVLQTRALQRFLPLPMEEMIVRAYVKERQLKLSRSQTSQYSTNPHFKYKFKKVMDVFLIRDMSIQIKVQFICRSFDLKLLPVIDKQEMTSKGSASIGDVLDFLFYNDNLWKYVEGVQTPQRNKQPDPSQAQKYIELLFEGKILKEVPNQKEKQLIRKEVVLDPNVTIGDAIRFIHDLLEIDNLDRKTHRKEIPVLLYRIKEGARSKGVKPNRSPQEVTS